MQDILFVAMTMAFFAICVAYVRGLDRLVRGTEEVEAAAHLEEEFEESGVPEVAA
jgi:hypothetical protein